MTVARETVIGLEIHVQLRTATKMFCGTPVEFGAPPNTLVCPVCLGLPGSLPVPNRRAIELGLRAAVALECRVHPRSQFHRKNYFYPDVPKNYQISQYEYNDHPPLATGGRLAIPSDGGPRVVRIHRVHLEEDTGKLMHSPDGYSLVDFNRSGVPLMEVVTEPDLRSPAEARGFLSALRTLLLYVDVSTGRMEEGTMRVDANISLRRPGEPLGTRTEVKNLNSLRSLERALAYEAERQRQVLDDGGRVEQETRHWEERREITFASRTKEEAQDYRYFPEPDLVPIEITDAWLDEIRRALPELPAARLERFVTRYGLAAHEAELVTSSRALADYYEAVVRAHPNPRAAANWLVGDVAGYLNERNLGIDGVRATPAHLATLLRMLDDGTISGRTAKDVLTAMLETGEAPETIVARRGLVQISDDAALIAEIERVIAEHPGPVEEYRSGKTAVLTFLVGQVMKRTRGRGNPEAVNRLLRERLGR